MYVKNEGPCKAEKRPFPKESFRCANQLSSPGKPIYRGLKLTSVLTRKAMYV